MKFAMIGKILGVLLMLYSVSMLTPIPFSLYYHNHDAEPFLVSFFITFGVGAILWLWLRSTHDELRTRDGFLVVFCMWLVVCIFGALPFMLSYSPHTSLTFAVFETTSGLTTTGATILSHIDGIPQSILYYRQQLQFLGGMGIIVLAVAIMPMIGVGGMQLYKAETTGPMKDNKITPRITETAKALWTIYVGLTIVCGLLFWLEGMDPFDAMSYAFATLSTGGFAPHNASMAYYPSPWIYITAIVFMILGGTNFSLHYLALHKYKFKTYWSNPEFRTYIFIIISATALTIFTLAITDTYLNPGWNILNSLFQVVSFMTTTGFTSDPNYAGWPLFLPILLLFVGIMGACAGSTTGGIKIIRILILHKQIGREIQRLIHPQGVFPLKLDTQVIPDRVMSGIWAFLAAYVLIFSVLWLVLMASGNDMVTAFSALATCIANIGPGLGAVSSDFHSLNDFSLWVLSLAMLIGRLEVFTVLVLLSPTFWRR